MNLLLTFSLLLFETGLNLGHSLPMIELNATDIYTVEENNSVKIVNPKAEKPTLREIIYYHLIERPYYKEQISKEHDSPEELEIEEMSIEQPEIEEPQRQFTNSHGFQFLDSSPENDTKPTSNEINDYYEDEITNPDEEPSAYEDNEGIEYYEDENTSPDDEIEEPSESDEESDDTEEPDAPYEYYYESYEEVDDAEPSNALSTPPPTEGTVNTETEVKTEAVIETESTIAIEVTTESEIATTAQNVVIEKKNARNQLFEDLKKRYAKSRMLSGTLSRRKRQAELDDIPEAPRLPELNFDSLPEYVREIITTEKPLQAKTKTSYSPNEETDKVDINDDKYIKKLIHEELEEMLANLTPNRDVVSEESEEYEESGEGETPKVPRTYGMNLTMDKGYVWNALWSDPAVLYDVGVTEDGDDIAVENKREENTNVSPHTTETSHKRHEFDIFVNIPKNKTVENSKPEKHSKIHAKFIDPDEYSEETVPNYEESEYNSDDTDPNFEVIESNSEEIESNGEEIGPDDEDYMSNSEETATNDENVSEETKPLKDRKLKPNKQAEITVNGKKVDILLEIMKDERFWRWLSEWTSTYVDLLTKYFKNVIKEEIAKHMKACTECTKHDNSIDKSDVPIDSKKEEVTDNDDKLIIDGKETPITHNSNFNVNEREDTIRQRKKDNDEDDATVNVDTQKIYGNSVGNDKVTNIYIFYPNKETEEIIEDVKQNIQDNIHHVSDIDNKKHEATDGNNDLQENPKNTTSKDDLDHETDKKTLNSETSTPETVPSKDSKDSVIDKESKADDKQISDEDHLKTEETPEKDDVKTDETASDNKKDEQLAEDNETPDKSNDEDHHNAEIYETDELEGEKTKTDETFDKADELSDKSVNNVDIVDSKLDKGVENIDSEKKGSDMDDIDKHNVNDKSKDSSAENTV